MDLNKPLAFRMSTKTLEDYVGQEHILGKDKILYRTIKADRLYYGGHLDVAKHLLLELLVIQLNTSLQR